MFGAPPYQASSLRLAAPLLIGILFAAVAHGCTEAEQTTCFPELSFFDETTCACSCQPGIFDVSLADGETPGTNCTTESAVVRISWKIGIAWDDDFVTDAESGTLKNAASATVKNDVKSNIFLDNLAILPTGYTESFTYTVVGKGAAKWFSAAVLYRDLAAADAAVSALNDAFPIFMNGSLTDSDAVTVNGLALTRTAQIFNAEEGQKLDSPFANGYMSVEPRAYQFTTGTTEDPIFIKPVGLDVDRVYFKHNCLSAGCWVVDVTYTIGENNFNVFYVPRTDNDDGLSYDYDYVNDAPVIEDTFYPVNFPCGNDAYTQDATEGVETTISACCITQFVDKYRNLAEFTYDQETNGGAAYTTLDSACWGSGNENVGPTGVINHPNAPIVTTDNMPMHALDGYFSDYGINEDLTYSYVESTGVIDPYLGIYTATFFMDEIELRRYCGKLSGTVSVQHTVDFFIGLAEFKPTGLPALNMATKQIDIKVEKTDYFTVATHGTNDYTFLRYVNMRLVEILVQDEDNTADVASDSSTRTDRTNLAQYVQVTFTVGTQYEVKPDFDIIPLDSVRVGKGDFLVDNTLYHSCLDYGGDYAPNSMFNDSPQSGVTGSDQAAAFNNLVAQDCAPQTAMCSNPNNIDDHFVVFNVPVGFNWFPAAASDLSSNVFVSMVIQVQNREAMDGITQASNITKTTLTASIPVVAGGINIFCDRITEKIDLQDVAQAYIWVGSASSMTELSRLRAVGRETGGIASSTLNPRDSTQIDSDSIESGLMTLVIAGNHTYFKNANQYGLEVEDLLTIHIMEDPDATGGWEPNVGGTCFSRGCEVLKLINSPGDENFDSNNALNTEGYALNGAFWMTILRSEGRARIDPTPALNALCSFRASGSGVTPAGASFATTCIMRRDIDGKNTYNNEKGGSIRVDNTATEVPACSQVGGFGSLVPGVGDDQVLLDCVNPDLVWSPFMEYGALTPADFMVTILGDSNYATKLGEDFAKVIRTKERLNNRYTRAFWINPGYEWTPTQTGGQSKFQLSQKILMFALVNLNEKRGADILPDTGFGGGESLGRRVLLADGADDTPSSFAHETAISPLKILATANGFKDFSTMTQMTLKMKLSQEQVCDMSQDELFVDLNALVQEDIYSVASNVAFVQVISVDVDRTGVACRRSMSRQLLAASVALADVGVVVGFSNMDGAKINIDELEKLVELAVFADNSPFKPTTTNKKVSTNPTGDGSTAEAKDEEEGSSSSGALIGGIVGGIVGAALLAGIAYFVVTRKESTVTEVVPMAATAAQNDLDNLKAQLHESA